MKTEVYLSDFSGWEGLVSGDGNESSKEQYLTPEGQRQARLLASGLSEERQRKISSLRFGKNRLQSLAAGLLLNYGLCRYGLLEREAGIRVSPHGKLYSSVRPELKFSLSHSGSCALLVISDRECGCDIQKSAWADDRMAARFFAREEAEYLRGIPEGPERDRTFTALWTRRESFAKLTGEGLGRLFSGFCALPDCTPPGCAFFTWELQEYVASVCVEMGGENDSGSVFAEKEEENGWFVERNPAAPVPEKVPWAVLIEAENLFFSKSGQCGMITHK